MTLLKNDRLQAVSLAQFRGEFHYSYFQGASGVKEVWLTLCPTTVASFTTQLDWLEQGFNEALHKLALNAEQVVFKRFLCSDLINQAPILNNSPFANPEGEGNGAVSLVQQPPLAPAKVALTVYLIVEPSNSLECNSRALNTEKQGQHFSVHRQGLTHTWTTGLVAPQLANSYQQTQAVFADYQSYLDQSQQTLLDNVVRTWFYVKDVDSNYQGLVDARNEIFDREGLTPASHYIASTGIEGGHLDPKTKVVLDSYSIKGLQAQQVRYLNALDYLGYTHDYGVAFERATQVSYADRKHIFISGTASIDNKGQIVHQGNVELQLERTLENISALLADAGASLTDLKQCIVYIRDPADAQLINQLVNYALAGVPYVVVTAPVCRPGWLIEIEAIACLANNQKQLPPF